MIDEGRRFCDTRVDDRGTQPSSERLTPLIPSEEGLNVEAEPEKQESLQVDSDLKAQKGDVHAILRTVGRSSQRDLNRNQQQAIILSSDWFS